VGPSIWRVLLVEINKAIRLNPSYATAYERYSFYLRAMGRTEESFEEINRRAN